MTRTCAIPKSSNSGAQADIGLVGSLSLTMGKGRPVSKKKVLDYSRAMTPLINAEPKKLTHKEVKRRTILAGLRCMCAPAVAWHSGVDGRSREPCIEELKHFAPRLKLRGQDEEDTKVSLVDHYVDKAGKHRIKGNKNLKGSQSYPIGFGVALAKLRSRHAGRIRKQASIAVKENVKTYRQIKRVISKDAMWIKHAQLKPIFDFIS
eukprot:Skav229302  [mRNA]  locus=scaffold544:313061:315403:+ [translate_table: standard]